MDEKQDTGAEQQPVVRCLGLTKHYGEGAAAVAALRGIDLEVRRGELLMILGPSGCGKTTLLSIITAILDQDEGRCEVLGRELRELGDAERIRFRGRAIGFLFQAFNLLPALSALENVTIPLLLNGVARKAAEQRAKSLLDEVGLGGRSAALPSQLSGGQQQRVAIARALVHEPQLVVCDEPTSNLDHRSGQEMMYLLRDAANASERTLIVVTHDNRILDFADRIAQMEDGRIVSIGTANAEGQA
jgi:putative ABC transport system ATP-binding protein